MTVADKLVKPGPRKLLALDGGGIRGLITIEVLAEIERLLREDSNVGDEFVLADYFDYIAGTSTGAVIATCLSVGMSVEQIRDFYVENATDMFDQASLLRRFRYKYEDDHLARRLRKELGEDTTLGSDQLRTLLLIVVRNATTDSPWPISNNPAALYNRSEREFRNLDIPLWQLVRASTAAPTYFPPEVIDIGGGRSFVFVDGGVTMYNNPAFQLFLMATLEPYNLGWATGEEQMLLVSIGTGTNPHANEDLQPGEMNLLYNAGSIPSALMGAALNEQDLLCRVFGRRLEGDRLDREVGDLATAGGPVDPKLFTYARYNAELSNAGLTLIGVPEINPADVQRLDSIEHIAELQQVGRGVATKVKREHFAGFPD
jgi:patatin-like phospholipase/acyl hydrolase